MRESFHETACCRWSYWTHGERILLWGRLLSSPFSISDVQGFPPSMVNRASGFLKREASVCFERTSILARHPMMYSSTGDSESTGEPKGEAISNFHTQAPSARLSNCDSYLSGKTPGPESNYTIWRELIRRETRKLLKSGAGERNWTSDLLITNPFFEIQLIS